MNVAYKIGSDINKTQPDYIKVIPNSGEKIFTKGVMFVVKLLKRSDTNSSFLFVFYIMPHHTHLEVDRSD